MNVGKFASLTAGLLVRKGEAHPSVISASPVVNFPSQERRQEGHTRQESKSTPRPSPSRKAAAGKPPPPPREQPVKPRRLMVTLTPSEFETLGHMSVRKGTSRHQIVRTALDEYMALLGEEYGGECQCIYTGCSCE
jgi:hypothetical protein